MPTPGRIGRMWVHYFVTVNFDRSTLCKDDILLRKDVFVVVRA